MSPLAGFVRFRSHQIGVETTFGTAVAATRRRLVRGPIEINPNTTDPDVDTGSLDPVVTPISTSFDLTASLTADQATAYNELVDTFAYGIKGGVTATGGGAAKTWTYQGASLTADPIATATDEWGSDTNATDGIKAFSGTINSFELSIGSTDGIWTTNEDWIYSGMTFGAMTGALTADSAPAWLWGDDLQVYLDPTPGAIGTTRLVDAIHGAAYRHNNNLDVKRFRNGSNTRRQKSGFARGAREIEYEITVAKTTATMAQKLQLDDAAVTQQYMEFRITSAQIITGSTPFSLSLRSPVTLRSVTEGEEGGNEILTLTYRAFYDTTLTYAILATLVNSRTTL